MINPVTRCGGKRRPPCPRLGYLSGGGGGERSPRGGPGPARPADPQRRRRRSPQFLGSASHRRRPPRAERSGAGRECPARHAGTQRPSPRPPGERPAGRSGAGARLLRFPELAEEAGGPGCRGSVVVQPRAGMAPLSPPRLAARGLRAAGRNSAENPLLFVARWSTGSSSWAWRREGGCLTQHPRTFHRTPAGTRCALLTEWETLLPAPSAPHLGIIPTRHQRETVGPYHCSGHSTRLKKTKQIADIISVGPTVNKT